MGTLGAFVSVLMRMSSNSFQVDYEVGRSTIRRLGSFRPFIGADLRRGDVLPHQERALEHRGEDEVAARQFFFFGSLAFLAGFNERWTNVIFGQAEQTIAASLSPPTAAERRRRKDEDED